MHQPTGMRLFDTNGHRLYLANSEREAFRKAAEQAPREIRLPYLALYRVQAFGGPGTHRRPRGLPGPGDHVREQEGA